MISWDCSVRVGVRLQAASGRVIFRLARVGPSCGPMSWRMCPWAPPVFRLAKTEPFYGPASLRTRP